MKTLPATETAVAAGPGSRRLATGIACLSAGVIGFEIALMRILLVVSWHHFAFLVLGIALVGFGASGTLLSLGRRWWLARGHRGLFGLALGAALSMPVCVSLALRIPIEGRFLPALLWSQVGGWLLLWGLLLVPFLLGGAAVGLALTMARTGVRRVYAGNLLGSGIGAALMPPVMEFVPPAWLPVVTGLVVLCGAVLLVPRRRGPVFALFVAVSVIAFWLIRVPPVLRLDPFKFGAHVRRLVAQGTAERIAAVHGPRSTVECFRSDAFHHIPFLGTGVLPPPAHALLVDGHLAGSIPRISFVAEAAFLDRSLPAAPYDLVRPRPRVLLLGARGTVALWLAKARGARTVDHVQGDRTLVEFLRGPLAAETGFLLDREGVRVQIVPPRLFVEGSGERYDLIHLVGLQSTAAGSFGVAGLAEDHLTTVEGIGACLERLDAGGVLAVCRAIQTPPRDNLKLLATFAAALRRRGVEDPGRHVLIFRDYLGVCTVVRTLPWTGAEIERVRHLCHARELTPVWFPGIRTEELNRPDELPGPPGERGDWFHHAAVRLFSEHPDEFIASWVFDLRPPTDDRPYFLDFFSWRSMGVLRAAFGDLWLTRTELAFLFACVAAGVITLLGALLTVVPLLFSGRLRASGGRRATALYFTAIGLAYLLLEMAVLSRCTLLVGDPVEAAALVIATFLVFSGLGSLSSDEIERRLQAGSNGILVLLFGIAAFALLALFGLGTHLAPLPLVLRALVVILLIAPGAFLMGLPMPMALARLHRAAPVQIPWAWGVNGFASVLAPSLAILLGMTWGTSRAVAVALVLYLAAGCLFRGLPGSERADEPRPG